MSQCLRCEKEIPEGAVAYPCDHDNHKGLGDVFCVNCSKQRGNRFYSPFMCHDCTTIEPKTSKRPRRYAKKITRHERLFRLRDTIGIHQDKMADLLGISPRQYQKWELSEEIMPLTAKKLCFYIAQEEVPNLASDWEGDMTNADEE